MQSCFSMSKGENTLWDVRMLLLFYSKLWSNSCVPPFLLPWQNACDKQLKGWKVYLGSRVQRSLLPALGDRRCYTKLLGGCTVSEHSTHWAVLPALMWLSLNTKLTLSWLLLSHAGSQQWPCVQSQHWAPGWYSLIPVTNHNHCYKISYGWCKWEQPLHHRSAKVARDEAKRKAKAIRQENGSLQNQTWGVWCLKGSKPISAFQRWDKTTDITMQVVILQMKK